MCVSGWSDCDFWFLNVTLWAPFRVNWETGDLVHDRDVIMGTATDVTSNQKLAVSLLSVYSHVGFVLLIIPNDLPLDLDRHKVNSLCMH